MLIPLINKNLISNSIISSNSTIKTINVPIVGKYAGYIWKAKYDVYDYKNKKIIHCDTGWKGGASGCMVSNLIWNTRVIFYIQLFGAHVFGDPVVNHNSPYSTPDSLSSWTLGWAINCGITFMNLKHIDLSLNKKYYINNISDVLNNSLILLINSLVYLFHHQKYLVFYTLKNFDNNKKYFKFYYLYFLIIIDYFVVTIQ